MVSLTLGSVVQMFCRPKEHIVSLCVRKLANHSVADELNPIKESLLNSPGIDTRS